MFRFLATSCTGQVSYSGLCTSLDKVVQILAALSPLADHVALQLPEGLKPGHQPADLPWLGIIVQTVQPLKGSAVLSWQLSCSTVSLIYMKGVKSENLSGMVEFFYRGEANVSQGDLEDFLALADEMRLKGLSKLEESQETLDDSQIGQTQNHACI